MSVDYKDLGILNRDADLEQRITDACARLSMATDEDQAREIFERVRALIYQRSPEQIERLERAKGLRR